MSTKRVDNKTFLDESHIESISVYREEYHYRDNVLACLKVKQDNYPDDDTMLTVTLKVARQIAKHMLAICDTFESDEKVRKDAKNAKRRTKRQEAKQQKDDKADKKASDQTAGWINIIRGNKDK